MQGLYFYLRSALTACFKLVDTDAAFNLIHKKTRRDENTKH